MAGGFIWAIGFALILEYYVKRLLKWGGCSKLQIMKLKA